MTIKDKQALLAKPHVALRVVMFQNSDVMLRIEPLEDLSITQHGVWMSFYNLLSDEEVVVLPVLPGVTP